MLNLMQRSDFKVLPLTTGEKGLPREEHGRAHQYSQLVGNAISCYILHKRDGKQ